MKKLFLFFGLAYFISWMTWLPLILPKYGIDRLPVLPNYHHYLGSFGPMIAAFIVRFISEGWVGVNDLLNRIVKWKVNWVWYFVILIIPVLLFVTAGFTDQLVNKQDFSMTGFSTNDEFPQFGPVEFFLFNFITFGVGEETGWRGYALPKLQSRFSALASSLLLAVGWAVWHLPAFIYRPLYSKMDVAGISGFFVSLIMGGIVLTWLYNSTKGSIFIVALFHAMIELMFMSANVTQKMSSYLGATIMVIAIFIIVVARPKHLSFVARQILK